MFSLYQNIRQRRIALGMSQEELAEKLGYTSRSTIAKIESGTNDITQSKIVAFAQALNTTPAQLMGWEETPPALPPISKKEQRLLDAYRKSPHMQKAVDRLLGLDTDECIPIAARSGKHGTVKITKNKKDREDALKKDLPDFQKKDTLPQF